MISRPPSHPRETPEAEKNLWLLREEPAGLTTKGADSSLRLALQRLGQP
jgi:hypothetical protein